MWDNLREFRQRRARSRNYYRGIASEARWDKKKKIWINEDDEAVEQGRIPLKMNNIGNILRNLKGQFRANKTQRFAYGRNRDDNETAEMMSEALRNATDLNQTTEIDTDQFEESLLSGMYGWRTGFEWNADFNREEISIDPLDTTRMFLNLDFKDRRLKGLRVIGEIMDVTLDEIIAQFAKTKAHENYLRSKYADYQNPEFNFEMPNGFDRKDAMDFYYPVNPAMCRLIVSWRYEYKWRRFFHDPVTGTYDVLLASDEEVDKLNSMRVAEAMVLGMEPPRPIKTFSKYEGVWRAYFLTPFGDVLYEGDTPFEHEKHPYTIGFLSLVDGEVWGMVEEITDAQRMINKLTQAIDQIFGASAKGVLMLPEEAIPDTMTPQDFADEWVKFNGAIIYKAKNLPNGHTPHQITAASIPIGMVNWMQMMQENIKTQSGVQGAAVGQEPTAGTPASLYHQQVQQSQTSTRDYFDSFFETRRQRDLRVCQLIAQYYNEPMMIAITSKRADGKKFIKFSPSKVRNIQWDIIVSDTADTPAFRQLMEDYLTGFLQEQRITFPQYLSLSSHPKADAILSVIEQTNPLLNGEIQDEQQKMQLQLAAQGGDKDAIATITQAQ